MYFLGLLLFIAICNESVSHMDYDLPEYLPLNLSCEHLFLEAVQRSRFKPKMINNSKKNFLRFRYENKVLYTYYLFAHTYYCPKKKKNLFYTYYYPFFLLLGKKTSFTHIIDILKKSVFYTYY